jgi:hypothetical protein
VTAHFDDEGRFIHRCCKCGAHAAFGYGVNLRADKLGTWYCGHHRPTPKTISPEQAQPPRLQQSGNYGGHHHEEEK